MNLPKPYLVRTGLDEILDGLHEGDDEESIKDLTPV